MKSPTSTTDDVAKSQSPGSKTGNAENDGKPTPKTDSLVVGEMMFRSLDPLDSRRVSLDVFELYCHEMLMTPHVGRRAFIIKKMRYMVHRLIGHQYDYGRLYNRTVTANIVARVCGRHAYWPDENNHGNEHSSRVQLADCLIDFTAEKWGKVMDQFKALRESLTRNDAALIVLPSDICDKDWGGGASNEEELIPESDERINQLVFDRPEFTTDFANMLESMKFFMCLSRIQPDLDKLLQKRNQDGAESVVIPHEKISAFDNAIEECFGESNDCKYARILNSLLDENKSMIRTTRYAGLHLKSFHDIKNIYLEHSRVFDLERFQLKFLKLIRRWTELILPIPELARLKYGSLEDDEDVIFGNKENVNSLACTSPGTHRVALGATLGSKQKRQQQHNGRCRMESLGINTRCESIVATSFTNEADDESVLSEEEDVTKEGVVDDLTRKRKALMNNVSDPLDACVAMAESAEGRNRAAGDKKQVYSTKIAKVSKAGKNSLLQKKASATRLSFTDSEASPSIKLSEIPAHFELENSQERARVIPVQKVTKKRKKFTETEDHAIRNGVERFGVGKWVDIKAYYSHELKDRDTVQIKDRYRTLTKDK